MVECRIEGLVAEFWNNSFENFNFDDAVYSCCSGGKAVVWGKIHYSNSSTRECICY